MPDVIVLAGPNGAGKSTAAAKLLQGPLQVTEFVNAAVIARGPSAFHPEGVSMAAGRIMLTHLRELAADRKSVAFETTLASRSFAPWLKKLIESGYSLKLFFFWLPSADMAIRRVAERVTTGGHSVPDETIRRRYERGLSNLFESYLPIADAWFVYDSSQNEPTEIARGGLEKATRVSEVELWRHIATGRSA